MAANKNGTNPVAGYTLCGIARRRGHPPCGRFAGCGSLSQGRTHGAHLVQRYLEWVQRRSAAPMAPGSALMVVIRMWPVPRVLVVLPRRSCPRVDDAHGARHLD